MKIWPPWSRLEVMLGWLVVYSLIAGTILWWVMSQKPLPD
jgi:hypothetical protein